MESFKCPRCYPYSPLWRDLENTFTSHRRNDALSSLEYLLALTTVAQISCVHDAGGPRDIGVFKDIYWFLKSTDYKWHVFCSSNLQTIRACLRGLVSCFSSFLSSKQIRMCLRVLLFISYTPKRSLVENDDFVLQIQPKIKSCSGQEIVQTNISLLRFRTD
jgi:hypothetical protein